MPGYYNLTNITRANNFGEMVLESTKIADANILGVGLIAAVFLICYVSLKDRYDSQLCMLSASFISMIVATILTFTQLRMLSQSVFWTVAIIMALSYVFVSRVGQE